MVDGQMFGYTDWKKMESKLDDLTNHQLLTDMELDWTIFKLKHRQYPNVAYLWNRWVRS